MEIFFTILIMTLVVSLSGVFTRVLPFQLPLPLMQIAIGALLAWPTFGLHVEFDPELFLVLFIPPLLLQHLEVADHAQQLKEERIARAATAEVAIVAIQKMEERLAADTEENIDNQLLTEVSSRVIGNLRRRADGRNDVESSIQEENLERRFRLAALRSERAELYHLRATREISNETLQKLLHDLDLMEALLIENQ